MSNQDLQQRYSAVCEQISTAASASGRAPQAVQLLAVSKTQPTTAIQALYQQGQHAFGENYLQEALEKITALKELTIEWHFIGHVQRNKTKAIAENFAWVHGVDRLIIAERLANQRPKDLQPLNICLQVNIDQQDSKDGCKPDEVAELVQQISRLAHIRLRGLMIIPRPDHPQAFEQARQLFEQVKTQHARSQDWDTLSMGMSADMDAAIAAGATIVRVGTALFGNRA